MQQPPELISLLPELLLEYHIEDIFGYFDKYAVCESLSSEDALMVLNLIDQSNLSKESALFEIINLGLYHETVK